MKPPRQIIIVSISLAAAVLVTAGAGMHCSAVAARNRQLEALRHEHGVLEARLRDDGLQRRVAYLRRQVGDHDEQRQEELTTLLQDLAEDLNELSVKVRSLTTGAHHSAGGLQQVPLSLSFQGSLSAIFELLKRFDDYQLLTRVEQLTIAREPSAPVDALSVSMRLETFGPAIKEARPWRQASESE